MKKTFLFIVLIGIMLGIGIWIFKTNNDSLNYQVQRSSTNKNNLDEIDIKSTQSTTDTQQVTEQTEKEIANFSTKIHNKEKARQKRVIVDEAWMLLPFPEAVDFLNKMARRARKRNVSLAIISQRFQDFYEKPEAQAVLTSSDTKLFLAQDKSEIQQLKEVFKLSEGEASFLVTCSKGEGLLKVGQDTAVIQITPTRKEFEFVETNMNKLVANNQRDDQRNINKN